MNFNFKYFLAVFFLFSCAEKQVKTSPKIENITESVYASGIVKSTNQYKVFATVSGLIERILVKEGDLVKRGSPIMKIGSETAQLNKENAALAERFAAESEGNNGEKINDVKMKIELAKSKMINDTLLLHRQRDLWQHGSGTLNDLEQRILTSKNSTGAYKSALLELKELQRQLQFNALQSKKNLQISNTIANDYVIKSEMNGRIYDILLEEGELVSPQLPVAIIGDADSFMLELQIDEYDIAKMSLGQKVLISMESYKGQVFDGVIKKIYPIMNEVSRTFTLEAYFIKRPAVLYPNLSVEANIIIQKKNKALTIPLAYLIDNQYVILLNHEKRKVLTGLKDYQKVEIVKGLASTDVLIKPVK